MTIATTTDTTPHVWVGCLTCYNDGRLVGDWHDASDADDVTTADVHGRASSHDELWCFDIENFPVRREMSPNEAAEWGRVFDEADEHQREALHAWVASGDYVAEGTGDLPSTSDFEERYAGHWDSFEDYARQLAEDIGLLNDVPEEIATYFDWPSWVRDLALDYCPESRHMSHMSRDSGLVKGPAIGRAFNVGCASSCGRDRWCGR